MKRSTLIDDLAIKYKYLNHADVERTVELVFKHLGNALVQGQRIEIRNVGTWAVKTRQPRIARNPKTGEKVQVGIKKSVAFRMAKYLKIRINSNTPEEEVNQKIEKNVSRKMRKKKNISELRRIERKLDNYNHIMELTRTIVPLLVLIIQLIILFKMVK